MDWLKFMRGKCFGCGGTDHSKAACTRASPRTLCGYCKRPGHFADVCMDQFMGMDRDRGLRTQNRAQQAPPRTVGAVETQQQQEPTREDKQMKMAAELDEFDLKIKELNLRKAQLEEKFEKDFP